VPTRPAGYTGRRAHGPTLEYHQLPYGISTHSLTHSLVVYVVVVAAWQEAAHAQRQSHAAAMAAAVADTARAAAQVSSERC
jgi:hypothetical protein